MRPILASFSSWMPQQPVLLLGSIAAMICAATQVFEQVRSPLCNKGMPPENHGPQHLRSGLAQDLCPACDTPPCAPHPAPKSMSAAQPARRTPVRLRVTMVIYSGKGAFPAQHARRAFRGVDWSTPPPPANEYFRPHINALRSGRVKAATNLLQLEGPRHHASYLAGSSAWRASSTPECHCAAAHADLRPLQCDQSASPRADATSRARADVFPRPRLGGCQRVHSSNALSRALGPGSTLWATTPTDSAAESSIKIHTQSLGSHEVAGIERLF